MRAGRTDDLKTLYEKAFDTIGKGVESFSPRLEAREVGTVEKVNTGIATVSGLPGAGYEELLEFPGGVFGIAFNVDEDEIGVVLLGDYSHLFAGAVEDYAREMFLEGMSYHKARQAGGYLHPEEK
jgi:F-type H+-transporting ATPase subunit alpha